MQAIKRTKKVKQTSPKWSNRHPPWETKISPPPDWCIHSQLTGKRVKVQKGIKTTSQTSALRFFIQELQPSPCH